MPAVALALLSSGAAAQATTRVSVSSAGLQGNGGTNAGTGIGMAISADGRYVAFDSASNNVVPGDLNQVPDVFLHDRQTGVTTIVSVDSSGTPGNLASYGPVLSDDGRCVAFYSYADSLVPGDTNGVVDVFVRDVSTGATTRVSVDSAGAQGDALSTLPSISGDGRYVAFGSNATNLVPGDTNYLPDAFVHDRQLGITRRVSVDSTGFQGNSYTNLPSLSVDGRYVVFLSAANNLVAGDTNGCGDTFVHDMQTGETTRVSVDSADLQGDLSSSGNSGISADGRYVVFGSNATNLIAGDMNGKRDIFVRDRQGGTTTRVSVDSSGLESDGHNDYPSLSRDGRYVTFRSGATNLVTGDTNGVPDAFVHDMHTKTTTRVTVSSSGMQSDNYSYSSLISGNGNSVVFQTFATNLVLGDTNDRCDTLVHDRQLVYPLATFCLGDGSGTACPCSNTGRAGRGCNNTVDSGGSALYSTGVASISADSLVLHGTFAVPFGPGLYFQGTAASSSNGLLGFPLGNGIRCVVGATSRIEIQIADAYGASATTLPIHLLGSNTAGDVSYYQLWYRDGNPSDCTGAGFNFSTLIGLTWTP